MRTLLLLCLLLAGCEHPDPEKKKPGTGPAKAKREPIYPYPECKACMAWLRRNVGEPDSLEAIDWRRREGGIVSLKYRGKNDRGGWSVELRDFTVVDGKVIASQPWPDGNVGWDD